MQHLKRPHIVILLIALGLTSLLLYSRSTSGNLMSMQTTSPIPNALLPVSGKMLAANVASLSDMPAAAPAPEAMAGQLTAPSIQRRVVGKASLELVVADTEAVVKQINKLMQESGGYVANANLQRSNYNGDERLQGTVQLRVPADQLDTTLMKLEAMGIKARAKTINREDVTDQYSDIDAQLRNLQATETELRQLLTEVREKPNAKTEDILTVHRNLTDIRSQIDQFQGRKNMFDNLITLSTIDVTLTPDIVSQPVIETAWRPTVALRASLRALVGTLQTLTDVGIWFVVYFFPVLLTICIPLALLWLIIRSVMRWWSRRPMPPSVQNS